MNAISKALDEIKFRIPREILEKIFDNRDWSSKKITISIDEQIMVKVIRPRVMVDADLIGGVEVPIDLSNIPFQQTNDYTYVVRVPKDKTQNRSIISVMNITFADPHSISNFGSAFLQNNSALLNMGQALIDQHGVIPNASAGRCTIIGDNVVMVSEMYMIPSNCYMRAIVGNDSQMSHMKLRSYPDFAKACVLAVKAYIYNNHIVKLDMGELRGGQAIGAFKSIIEGYADADELYLEYMAKDFRAISVMNDEETWNRMLRSRVGGNR